MSNTQGGPGWWPDPTLRTTSAFAVAGVTTSIWVTVYAPVGTPAGDHAVSVTLLPRSQARSTPPPPPPPSSPGNPPPWADHAITAAVTVTVFGFALPVAPTLLTAFNLDESKLASICKQENRCLPHPSPFFNGGFTPLMRWTSTGPSKVTVERPAIANKNSWTAVDF